MSGNRDQNIVCVFSNLSNNQASRLSCEIMRAKRRVAPQCRATAAITTSDRIGALLQRKTKMIGLHNR